MRVRVPQVGAMVEALALADALAMVVVLTTGSGGGCIGAGGTQVIARRPAPPLRALSPRCPSPPPATPPWGPAPAADFAGQSCHHHHHHHHVFCSPLT